MAVMTSISPDNLANEHKTQPVPSSDKMALDLDINGTSNHDDQSRNLAPPDSSNKSPELPSKPDGEVENGLQNINAFETNNTFVDPLIEDALPDALLADATLDVDDLFSSAEVTTEAPESLSTLTTTQNTSLESTLQIQPQSADQQLEALAELPPVTSSVPPIVEAPESDLREAISPATQEQAEDVKAEKQDLDLTADSSLASASAETSYLDTMDSASAAPALEDASSLTQPPSFLDQPLHPQSVSDIDLNKSSQSDIPEVMDTSQDTNMTDAPSSPTKLARAREEDTEEGPSTKRTKTETETETGSPSADFAIPEVPASASTTQNDSSVPAPGDELAPTAYQQKEILKVIRQQKNTLPGKNFKDAVASLWPTLAGPYLEKVSNPIDLLLIENRLKDGAYATIGDVKKDLNLLYENCVIFNGPEHTVTAAANTVRNHIINRMPGPDPVKVDKKPPRKSTPSVELPREPRISAARRPSRGSAAPATSPKVAVPGDTFALGPSGTPLIRRDSTQIDNGRPKREIHPPKPRDLVYNSRPKKKFAQEMKFCDEVLKELQKPKYAQFNIPFLVPVDPVALGIPDYFKVIKNPMDLQTVSKKLTNGEITTAKQFESEVRMIFKNCVKFNPEGSAVHVMGKQLENLFDEEMAKKGQWMSDHPSPNNAASPYSSVGSEPEESEEEVEEPAPTSNHSALQARLVEEQDKLIALMSQKKPDQTLVRLQEDFIAMVKKQVEDSTKAEKTSKPKTKNKAPKKVTGPKKKIEPAKKAYRAKAIGMAEKEQISAGIAQLEGRDMEAAIAILKNDVPTLNVEEDEELDIDQFSNIALSKLHDLVVKRVPSVIPTKAESKHSVKQSRPKKNKPMSKTEQEAKIEKLKQLQDQFERKGSGSPEGAPVLPTVEQDQSSGDDESSDSEED